MTGASWHEALKQLRALEAPIDAALASGDVASAVRLAFGGASEAAALVSEGPAAGGLAAVHEVFVELAPQPLEAFGDGTLSDNGTYVTLAYQRWEMPAEQAGRLACEWASGLHLGLDSS